MSRTPYCELAAGRGLHDVLNEPTLNNPGFARHRQIIVSE
jgi:hypothetical protein